MKACGFKPTEPLYKFLSHLVFGYVNILKSFNGVLVELYSQ